MMFFFFNTKREEGGGGSFPFSFFHCISLSLSPFSPLLHDEDSGGKFLPGGGLLGVLWRIVA